MDPMAIATRISAYSTELAPSGATSRPLRPLRPLRRRRSRRTVGFAEGSTPRIIALQTVGCGPSWRIRPSRSADMIACARLAAPSFS